MNSVKIEAFAWNDLSFETRCRLTEKYLLKSGDAYCAAINNMIENCLIIFGKRGGIIGWSAFYKYGKCDGELPKLETFIARGRYNNNIFSNYVYEKSVAHAKENFGGCIAFRNGEVEFITK